MSASGALAGQEIRRAGWPALAAVPAVLAVGTGVSLLLAVKGSDAGVFLRFWLREVVPLAFGLAVPAVPAAETSLELQLSLPTPVPVTLARRAGLAVLSAALATAALTVVAYAGGLWHPAHGVLAGQLSWLSPALALGGLGAAVFALTASVTGAAAAVAGGWLVSDLTVQWFAGHGWTRVLYPFVDDAPGSLAGWWWPNRLTLLGLGAMLAGLAGTILTVQRQRVLTARLSRQGSDG
ncbi:hypothetical protein [Actinoplanes subtropicus]|uniref:hypothetical protein n=1 Tax=Actinoplanes subtropicus TaxID=543632 RepID=UPI000A800EFC|nr:hypothetical protein [Actinoplanes subtropicus]